MINNNNAVLHYKSMQTTRSLIISKTSHVGMFAGLLSYYSSRVCTPTS